MIQGTRKSSLVMASRSETARTKLLPTWLPHFAFKLLVRDTPFTGSYICLVPIALTPTASLKSFEGVTLCWWVAWLCKDVPVTISRSPYSQTGGTGVCRGHKSETQRHNHLRLLQTLLTSYFGSCFSYVLRMTWNQLSHLIFHSFCFRSIIPLTLHFRHCHAEDKLLNYVSDAHRMKPHSVSYDQLLTANSEISECRKCGMLVQAS